MTISSNMVVLVVGSGASRGLLRRRGIFQQYVVLKGLCVNTASGKAIPVVGCGNEGDIPNRLQVPTLEKDQLSVPHIDVEMQWRIVFVGGA